MYKIILDLKVHVKRHLVVAESHQKTGSGGSLTHEQRLGPMLPQHEFLLFSVGDFL
jgi:hypothetical protein